MPYPAQTPLEALNTYFSSLFPSLVDILLRVIGALVIFFVGWLVALLVRLAVEFLLRKINCEEIFRKLKIDQYFKDFTWEEKLDRVLAEIAFWVVFVVFLMVIFDLLGLQIVNTFIREILFYIPRAISGGLILLAGFLFGELAKKLIVGVFKGLEKKSAQLVAGFVKFVIVVFAILGAFSQWGVANEIVSSIAMGIVLFLALAGGLAFGLGGQETAREILENLKKRLG